MERLVEGYRRFRSQIWPNESARYKDLARWGQKPESLVIACSDSRVDPQSIFGVVPGEMFVVRNIAGFVPAYHPDGGCHGTSAAIEYGVKILGISEILILGHARCGGVRAMIEGTGDKARDFVEPWLAEAKAKLQPVAQTSASDETLLRYEAEIVRLSLDNLAGFPWVSDAMAEGRLRLQGFSFDIHSGVLSRLENNRFIPIS